MIKQIFTVYQGSYPFPGSQRSNHGKQRTTHILKNITYDKAKKGSPIAIQKAENCNILLDYFVLPIYNNDW